MKVNVSLEEAQDIVLSKARPVSQTMVSLGEALGRVVSRDLRAPRSVPAFDRSPVDGYALRTEDTEVASPTNPVVLTIVEEVPAGGVPTKKVTPGTAVKITTGAPIPEGANAVIRFEDVEETVDKIKVSSRMKPGVNIVPAGEDVLEGEIVARSGTRVNAPLLGVLASLGIASVPVYEKPKVAIITTGSELLDPAEPWEFGKIYNSNRYLLESRCKELGCEPLWFGMVPDETEAVALAVERAIGEADLVITTGGASVGPYDVVKDALKLIGAEILFSKLALKPGMPTSANHKDGKIVLSLSGNPAAASVIFELIAVPVIRKMMGLKELLPQRLKGVLANDFSKASPYRRILRAKWERTNGVDLMELTGAQSNDVLKSLVDCNVLIDVPAGSPPLVAGQKVEAFVIGDCFVTGLGNKGLEFTTRDSHAKTGNGLSINCLNMVGPRA